MNETFKASNGIDVSISEEGDGTFLLGKGGVIKGGVRRWTVATGNAEGIVALREFFQHERDQELGRWRWPENPDYVVYQREVTGHTDAEYRECTVLDERSGVLQEFGSKLPQCHGGYFREAARAYFAAHPEPKPWHEAVEGEVWLLMFPNSTQAWFVNGGYFQNVRTLTNINKTDPGITAGRRIWPEVSDA